MSSLLFSEAVHVVQASGEISSLIENDLELLILLP